MITRSGFAEPPANAAMWPSDPCRVEPDQLEQVERRGLRLRVEFGSQNRTADAVMPKRLCPLAEAHIAAHHHSMGILSAWVVAQQRESARQRR